MNKRSQILCVPMSRLSFVLCLMTMLVSLGGFSVWSYRLIGRRNHPTPSSFASISAFGELLPMPGELLVLFAVVLLAAFLLLRRTHLVSARSASILVFACLAGIGIPVVFSFGYYFTIFVVAMLGALLISGLLPCPKKNTCPQEPSRDRKISLLLWVAVSAMMCVFSMHRHAAYGSGSWDMGCMVHNFYRASRFLSTTSTVLGDVDFLGDHFMIGIYIYAPLFWLSSSGYMLLFIQSVNLAATAPAIYLIARHKTAPPSVAVSIALATALSFGMQSAAYFDSHEIVVGFGFLCWGLWAMETGRLRSATVFFVLFALFKESLGAYIFALGLLAVWRGIRSSELKSSDLVSKHSWLAYGTGWILFGLIWFVLVNRVFMPILIASASAPEPHETFSDFGPTIFLAIKGIFADPVKAVVGLFVPSTKVQSQLVTLGGFSWLSLASPQILIPALPLIVERFLSSKRTMWEMGYHYAAPLSLYAGWAVANGWPRLLSCFQRTMDGLGDWFGDRASSCIASLLLLSMLIINGAGYHHPANFLRWNMSYFASSEKRFAHDSAIKLLKKQGVEAKIAVQNRLLPHLADRPVVYRLHDWQKADWVLLSVGDNAWPKSDAYPRQLAHQLAKTEAWNLVFSENSTAIFARKGKHQLPAVKPKSVLGL